MFVFRPSRWHIDRIRRTASRVGRRTRVAEELRGFLSGQCCDTCREIPGYMPRGGLRVYHSESYRQRDCFLPGTASVSSISIYFPSALSTSPSPSPIGSNTPFSPFLCTHKISPFIYTITPPLPVALAVILNKGNPLA